jgi:glutamyl-tRNA synthetase
VQLFSIGRVNKSGARFHPEKTKWFNQQHLIQKSNKEISSLFKEILKEKGIEAADEYTEKVVSLVKERVAFVKEIWNQASLFFIAPTGYDPKVVKKRWKGDVPAFMDELTGKLQNIDDWKADKIKETISQLIEVKGLGFGLVMNALRLALVGGGFGPDLMTIAEMIGKDETINRIKTAIEKIEI